MGPSKSAHFCFRASTDTLTAPGRGGCQEAFPGIAPRLAVHHTATAGHPVDSHCGSILSRLLYSMARQWLHQPKGPLHRPNQTKVQDALKGRRVSLRSGASWAGTGRDGGDPSAAARRPRWPACTLSAEAFRRPHLRFEPPACDTPPPPHPDRHGKQRAAGLLISEV